MLFIHINYTSINLTWKSSRAPMSRLVDAPTERERERERERREEKPATSEGQQGSQTGQGALGAPPCASLDAPAGFGRVLGWPGPVCACVRSFNAGKGRAQKRKKRQASSSYLFCMPAPASTLPPLLLLLLPKSTHAFIVRGNRGRRGGHTKSATKIVAGMKYSAVRSLSLLLSPQLVSPLCRYQPRCDVRW